MQRETNSTRGTRDKSIFDLSLLVLLYTPFLSPPPISPVSPLLSLLHTLDPIFGLSLCSRDNHLTAQVALVISNLNAPCLIPLSTQP